MKSIVLLLVFASSVRAEATRPNILIFYLDDMGWAQPGAYGGKMAPTPNMDALAAGGVRFTNGYSSGCVCSPGRVGLMTGRYQARTGHDANPTKAGRELLLSETTMAQHLKTAGYTTGIVGKWHLGDTSAEFMPPARGFDFAMGTVGNLGEGKGPSFYRGKELQQELPGAPVTSPVYAAESVKFIDANRDKPWFLYLSFNAVHSPHVASEKWLEKFKDLPKRDAPYAALAAEADEAIGTVMMKLRELKQEENTLIFLLSDNGGAYQNAEMGGLRGHKWFVWEGGIRVSWLAAWKGRIPAGRVSNEPVIQLDVLPTALAAAQSSHLAPRDEPSAVKPGHTPESSKTLPANEAPSSSRRSEMATVLDGVNLLPLLEGKTDQLAPRELYFRFGVQHAVRQGDWKLVKASKAMQPMLVNLATDPGEQTDLTAKEPEKAKALQQLFDQWNATMQPPRWEDERWNGDESRKEQKKDKRKKKAKE
ncbi:MAG: sulfatase [Prosthecobacter sp.]|uniref:sulfatase family protein n=1 Tax=Prosthecobacter sp. TaxID=1965333 RepID=UPI0039043A40